MYDHHIPTPKNDGRQAIFALNELITATRLLADTLKDTARQLHADLHVSVPERSVLLELRKNGPMTVPDLARHHEVTRQFIQTTVNPLLAAGVLETHPNLAHRRSKLVALTEKGIDLIRQVMRREGSLMQGLAAELAAEDIRQAADTLAQVQRLLAKQSG